MLERLQERQDPQDGDQGVGFEQVLSEISVPGDFPCGAAVKNSPANAGDMGSTPGPGRSHMPWNN